MPTIQNTVNYLKTRFNENEYRFYGEINERTVEAAENALGVSLPGSYREFLSLVGFIEINGSEIYGLTKNQDFDKSSMPEVGVPNVVWVSLQWRRDFNHPKQLIPIYEVGEGTTYCLNTSQIDETGECPIVVWPNGGYEQTPVLEVFAKNFSEFFFNLVEQEIQDKMEG